MMDRTKELIVPDVFNCNELAQLCNNVSNVSPSSSCFDLTSISKEAPRDMRSETNKSSLKKNVLKKTKRIEQM